MDSGTYKIIRLLRLTVFLLLPLLTQSCFTGVEGTKKIELSRRDRQALKTTPEEVYMNDIHGTPWTSWQRGKRFRVTDSKVALLFDQRFLPADTSNPIKKDIDIVYVGNDNAVDVNGREIPVLLFSAEPHTLRYNLSAIQSADSLLSTSMPMMIDMDAVHEADSLLRGKKLWTLSPIRYEIDGTRAPGLKFDEVEILEVKPGDTIFPLKIIFRDSKGNNGMMFMNFNDRTNASRRFSNLFTFSDPRKKYPSISEENWQLICRGEIEKGMTKEECRLALGNPSDVNQGNTHSYMLDLWQYTDGVTLFFEDGILKDFRK